MKKPRDLKIAFLEVYQDKSGYELGFSDRKGFPTSFIKPFSNTKDGDISDIEQLHKWLGECIKYIRWRKDV